jgi:sigma-B regulation protein RsbU (phosphoserine phosphatase)
MTGRSPAEVLRAVNEQICSNNREEMFVTVWFGILDTRTGKITAANAGHEYPALMPAGGQFELVKDKHGFVIGGMEGVRYKEYELQMKPGSKLFVYTDGVAEATSAEKELFGTERMIDALNAEADAAPRELLKNVRASVDGFVKEAEQFDDLTMLCVEYKGRGIQGDPRH